ncbi:MAG TPA: hypothetical protein VD813_11005 [Pseudonocardia sp.]|nr:hypothetical protein [Pseudonocardia sp.]
MIREDLLALTPDALAALSNRGLVKRATRETDAGADVTCAPDGTVEVRFPDGGHAVLPPGVPLDAATCSCGAPGACRHRIGAVLAYQRAQARAPAPEPVAWSPGSVTDEELAARFGARALAAAARTRSRGYTARVVRPSPGSPAAVETAAATVRFLVPGDLGYVDCDARAGARDELVVLAVWAFRAADAAHPGEPVVTVDIGGGAGDGAPAGPVLGATLTVVDELLRTGVSNAGPVLVAALRRERDALDRRGLHWPTAAVDDLVEQVVAYRERNAAHVAARAAELIAELHARDRAAAAAPVRVLGTEEQAETPLRQVRLVGLGARVGGDADADTAEVFLAQPSTGVVLVLRRRWQRRPDRPTPAVGARRVAGTTLAALAAGNVVSESAVRSAARVVRFAAGALARTAVTPLGGAWTDLPDAVRPAGVVPLREALSTLPPRPVRARVVAELVRVLPIARVESVGYHPGAQRLDAVVADPAGATATISLIHRPDTPGALDALARALDDGPRFVSGTVRLGRGGLVVDPLAVLGAGGPVVLDLAAVDPAAPAPAGAPDPDPLTAALDDALAVLAEAAHRGLATLPATVAARAEDAAAGLARAGMATSAAALRDWARENTVGTWVHAQIRLATAAELR